MSRNISEPPKHMGPKVNHCPPVNTTLIVVADSMQTDTSHPDVWCAALMPPIADMMTNTTNATGAAHQTAPGKYTICTMLTSWCTVPTAPITVITNHADNLTLKKKEEWSEKVNAVCRRILRLCVLCYRRIITAYSDSAWGVVELVFGSDYVGIAMLKCGVEYPPLFGKDRICSAEWCCFWY